MEYEYKGALQMGVDVSIWWLITVVRIIEKWLMLCIYKYMQMVWVWHENFQIGRYYLTEYWTALILLLY